MTLAFNLGGPTTATVASAANGPGLFVGQRYQIPQKDGSYLRGFIEALSGTNVTLSDGPTVPVAAGAPFWATFGAVYVTNAFRPQIDDIKCNDVWGCVLYDDPNAGSDSFHGVNHGWTGRVSSSGGRMFGIIKGRNVQAHLFDNIDIWGGWSQIDTWTGDGATTNFKLSFLLNRKREIYFLTVNGAGQTQGVDYTLDPIGLGVTLAVAPPSGAVVRTQYFTYGGVGFEDNCEDLSWACGGSQVNNGNILQWSDDLVFNKSQLPVFGTLVIDAAAFNCVLYDANIPPTPVNYLNLYWCKNQIKARNNSIYNSILTGSSAFQTSSYPVSGLNGNYDSIDVGSNVDWPNGIKRSWGGIVTNQHGARGFFYNGLSCWGCPETVFPSYPFQWRGANGNMMLFNGDAVFSLSGRNAYVNNNAAASTFSFQASGAGSIVKMDGQAQSQLAVNGVPKGYCDASTCLFSNDTFSWQGTGGGIMAFNGSTVLSLSAQSSYVINPADNSTFTIQTPGANSVVKIDGKAQSQLAVDGTIKHAITSTATTESDNSFTRTGGSGSETFDGANLGFTATNATVGDAASGGTMLLKATGSGGVAGVDGQTQAQLAVNGTTKLAATSTATTNTNGSFSWIGPTATMGYNGADTLYFTATSNFINNNATSGFNILQATGTGGTSRVDGKASAQLAVNGSVDENCTSTYCGLTVPLQPAPYTVAGLPTCNSTIAGSGVYASDMTLPYSGTLTGGAANKVPLYCDGVTWRPDGSWITSGGLLVSSYYPALTRDVTNTAGALAMTIANGAVTSAKMAAGAAVANIGFTPVNPASAPSLTFAAAASETSPSSFTWVGPTGNTTFNGADTLGFTKQFAYLNNDVASGSLSLQATGANGTVNMNGKIGDYFYVNNSQVAACTSTGCAFSVPVAPPTYTVSTLPTCSGANPGAVAYVTDALAPSWNATLAGSGSVKTLAMCNASNWTAH